jgi:hypothetical protein
MITGSVVWLVMQTEDKSKHKGHDTTRTTPAKVKALLIYEVIAARFVELLRTCVETMTM